MSKDIVHQPGAVGYPEPRRGIALILSEDGLSVIGMIALVLRHDSVSRSEEVVLSSSETGTLSGALDAVLDSAVKRYVADGGHRCSSSGVA